MPPAVSTAAVFSPDVENPTFADAGDFCADTELLFATRYRFNANVVLLAPNAFEYTCEPPVAALLTLTRNIRDVAVVFADRITNDTNAHPLGPRLFAGIAAEYSTSSVVTAALVTCVLLHALTTGVDDHANVPAVAPIPSD
jgi:hypothetical protein